MLDASGGRLDFAAPPGVGDGAEEETECGQKIDEVEHGRLCW